MMDLEKLYYQNQYIREFTTKVLRVEQDHEGRLYAVLESTAFYPTGGGQPHDTGTLNGVWVIDVEEVDGEVRHYIEESLDVQKECVGQIDWGRRFDHMQQHAGQHILSAIFEEVFGYKTVSFHLGKEICTIDLEVETITPEEAQQVEKRANDVILESRLIEAKWVTDEELANYPLRKDLSTTDNIRLVIIPNLDYNGCGGTHPQSTGQVGSLKILNWEKQKKKTRVHFVCGNRVLQQLHEKHQVLHSLTAILNVPQEKMVQATERILQQTIDLENTLDELRAKLLQYEANEFIANAEEVNGHKAIKAIFKNRQISELQQLAKLIANEATESVVIFINENDDKLQLVCARGNQISFPSMNQLVKHVLPMINGRGGGNDLFAQGGGDMSVSAERVMEEVIGQIK